MTIFGGAAVKATKAFPDVYEVDVQWGVPFYTLLDDVLQTKDLICAAPLSPEASLLRSQVLVNNRN